MQVEEKPSTGFVTEAGTKPFARERIKVVLFAGTPGEVHTTAAVIYARPTEGRPFAYLGLTELPMDVIEAQRFKSLGIPTRPLTLSEKREIFERKAGQRGEAAKADPRAAIGPEQRLAQMLAHATTPAMKKLILEQYAAENAGAPEPELPVGMTLPEFLVELGEMWSERRAGKANEEQYLNGKAKLVAALRPGSAGDRAMTEALLDGFVRRKALTAAEADIIADAVCRFVPNA